MISLQIRVEHIKGQRTTNTLTSAKTRRQTVASALARCSADEWVPVDDLFARMRRASLSPTVARSGRALRQTLKVLPNLDIVVTGDLPPADHLGPVGRVRRRRPGHPDRSRPPPA